MNIVLDAGERKQIDQCLTLLKNTLGPDLLGVYLYGSSILGGLQKYSDVDLFVISQRQTRYEEKASLEKNLLAISGIYRVDVEKRPIELLIVIESEIKPWKYPPRFDFQYGDWLRKGFEEGKVEPWTKEKILPDLAILMTQVLLASKTIYGPPPNSFIDPIPYIDIQKAILEGIDTMMPGFEKDITNGLLTLTRMWYTLENNVIASKLTASIWAIERVPEIYKPVLTRANAICLGENEEYWEDLKDVVKPCADLMITEIKKLASFIESSDYFGRTIRIQK